jgi:RNA polymerase sigma-70 factor, ECF subfamily
VEDRRARFERLYASYSPDIAMYALRRTDRETAKDVVAETFTVAWRKLDEVPARELPWLYGVARRVLANHRRSARRLIALRRRLDAQPAAPTELADPALEDAFRRLSDADREILALVAWEGLTPAEAAVVLGIEANASRLRLHRARRRLATVLGVEPATSTEHVIEEVC